MTLINTIHVLGLSELQNPQLHFSVEARLTLLHLQYYCVNLPKVFSLLRSTRMNNKNQAILQASLVHSFTGTQSLIKRGKPCCSVYT